MRRRRRKRGKEAKQNISVALLVFIPDSVRLGVVYLNLVFTS